MNDQAIPVYDITVDIVSMCCHMIEHKNLSGQQSLISVVELKSKMTRKSHLKIRIQLSSLKLSNKIPKMPKIFESLLSTTLSPIDVIFFYLFFRKIYLIECNLNCVESLLFLEN